jgi:hypothetical protein
MGLSEPSRPAARSGAAELRPLGLLPMEPWQFGSGRAGGLSGARTARHRGPAIGDRGRRTPGTTSRPLPPTRDSEPCAPRFARLPASCTPAPWARTPTGSNARTWPPARGDARKAAQGRAAARLGPAGVAFGAPSDHRVAHGPSGGLRAGGARASAPGAEIVAQRADITDRNGRILATNMTTSALYAHPGTWSIPRAPPGNWPRSSPNWTPPRWNAALPTAAVRLGPQGAVARTDAEGARDRRPRPACSARARCGFIPTARWPPMCWAAILRRRRRAFGRGDRHRRHRKGAGRRGCATRPRPARRWRCRWTCRCRPRSRRCWPPASPCMNAKGGGGHPDGCAHRRMVAMASAAHLRPQRPPGAAGRQGCRALGQPAVQPRGAGGLRTGLHLQDLRRRPGDGTGPGQPRHHGRCQCADDLGQVQDQGIRGPQLRPAAVGDRCHRRNPRTSAPRISR